jgi:hypothetical protein
MKNMQLSMMQAQINPGMQGVKFGKAPSRGHGVHGQPGQPSDNAPKVTHAGRL